MEDNDFFREFLNLLGGMKRGKKYSETDALVDIFTMADENGEFHSTVRGFMERWGWSNTKVVSFLSSLEEKDIIKTEKRQKKDNEYRLNTGFSGTAKDKKKTKKRQEKDNGISDETQSKISTRDAFRMIIESWGELSEYGIKPVTEMGITSVQYVNLVETIKEHSVADVISTIQKIKESDFLQGRNNFGWKITFDWFVRIGNYEKVRAGNYAFSRNGTRGESIEDAFARIDRVTAEMERSMEDDGKGIQFDGKGDTGVFPARGDTSDG